jgi:hypothetical protein
MVVPSHRLPIQLASVCAAQPEFRLSS